MPSIYSTIYSIWHQGKTKLVSFVPRTIRKRRLNFISIHYLYLISMSILGSVIIFGAGNIAYIDALFFASGAVTQSGLNTVNANDMNTAQQMVTYLLAMLCNPIFINTTVVFVRLYWFEKRFQHIVREAKTLRRTKSRTATMGKDEGQDFDKEERGVAGKSIKVMHRRRLSGPQKPDSSADESKMGPHYEFTRNSDEGSDSPDSKASKASKALTPPHDTDGDIRRPQQLSPEDHIAFLENQRHPKDATTLRIPSPREFDRGGKPEAVDEEDEEQGISPIGDPHLSNIDHVMDQSSPVQTRNRITIDEPNLARNRQRVTTFPRVGSRTATDEVATNDFTPKGPPRRRGTFSSIMRSYTTQEKEKGDDPMPYLSYQATIGRNSMFVGLTEEQREELGGIEYRALKTLALILVTYFFAIHIFGAICLIPWILHNRWGSYVEQIGQGRVWWGLYTSASAFNDLGFTLTPDSMESFYDAVFPLLLLTVLIVIGNTGFPCMLRFVIWVMRKTVPRGTGIWEELTFLLDHPRRCFTLLFPRGATWWLFVILVILNGLDLIFFIILDLRDSTVTTIPTGLRVVDGLFQASSTRTAGFSVVDLSGLHPAIQVSYLIMMYISVFPIAISLRRTNVYEEKSLGIYGGYDEEADDKEPSYISAHLRKQLSFDLWYVFLGLFIIAIAEGSRLQNTNEYSFSIFSVLFEIVSAYGTVGLSLGYPGVDTSFSGQFNVVSKLVIIAMQIRGRHRGLPYELDRAILLPSESLTKKETIEAEKRAVRRRNSNLSAVTGQPQSNTFRVETGLSTGSAANGSAATPRNRRGTDNSGASHPSTQHQSRARTGLGNMMFNLAGTTDMVEGKQEEVKN